MGMANQVRINVCIIAPAPPLTGKSSKRTKYTSEISQFLLCSPCKCVGFESTVVDCTAHVMAQKRFDRMDCRIIYLPSLSYFLAQFERNK